jgi:hypothetical protein
MFLECEDVKSAQFIVRFVNNMVLYLKKYNAMSEKLTEICEKIQDICIQKIEFPDWCTFEDGKLGEEEENYAVLRAELVNMFGNTLLLQNLKSRACLIIENKLAEVKQNMANMEQNKIELPLFLLSQMNSIIMREDKDLVNDTYRNLIHNFISIDFLASNSKIVSIMYFEV